MASDAVTKHRVTLVAVDPPFEPGQGVLFGPQRGRLVEEFEEAAATTTWDIEIGVARSADGGVDFKGPYVQGRKGDRFLYLSWGLPDGVEPFVMFARAKIKLGDLPDEIIDHLNHTATTSTPDAGDGPGLVAELEATNAKGQPASGTIRPPAVTWRLDR